MLLAACDTPSRAFKDERARQIIIGKSTFDIRVKGQRAEAIRLNSEWAPRLEAVAPRAMAAIEHVSGCEITRLYGDQAMVLADLRCKGQPLPPEPARPLICEPDGRPYARGDWLTIDLVCE